MNKFLLILAATASLSLSSTITADESETTLLPEGLIPTETCRPYPHCVGDDHRANFKFDILKPASK